MSIPHFLGLWTLSYLKFFMCFIIFVYETIFSGKYVLWKATTCHWLWRPLYKALWWTLLMCNENHRFWIFLLSYTQFASLRCLCNMDNVISGPYIFAWYIFKLCFLEVDCVSIHSLGWVFFHLLKSWLSGGDFLVLVHK